VAALAVVPLGFVVAYTIIIGPHDAFELLWRPRIGMLLWNTGRLVVGGVLASTLLGLACAWLVARTDLPGRRLLHGLFVAPLAVPAFVNSYSWVSITFWVQQYAGAVLVVTLSYFPLVYLPVVASLRGLDPALEESAASLGYTGRRTFLRVVLPQLAPALLGGALLVGLHLLSEFGALRMLNFPTFTTAIYDQYRSTFNGHAANMIAGVLVLACALLLTAELRMRGHKRYARVARGAARPLEPVRLGPATLPLLLFAGVVVALGVGVPCYSLVHWLLVGTSTEFPIGDLTSATANSLGLGAAGAIVTVLAALPVAWLVVRFRRPMTTLLERSTYVPNALPGIVVALALVTVSIRVFPSIYQTYVLLVAAYVILSLPRAVVSVRSALEQAPAVLDDVSHSLGVGPIATARRVTLPLIAPGIGAGAALVFLAVATELTATLMLAPIGTTTLATEFWSASSGVQYGRAAPYALLLVLISVPATILLAREASAHAARHESRHERGSR
jgi:iron(III) transport system permease protein